MVVSVASFLGHSYFKIKNHCIFFEIKSLSLESQTQERFADRFCLKPTVTSRVLFPTILRQFFRPRYDYEAQKVALFNFEYLCDY